VRWFWEVAHALAEEAKKRLLFFVTGSDRVPIKGLGHLNPPFVVSRCLPQGWARAAGRAGGGWFAAGSQGGRGAPALAQPPGSHVRCAHVRLGDGAWLR
jgi:hypothetical protein